MNVDGSPGPLDFYVVRLPSLDAIPFEAVREVLSLVDAEIIAVIDLVVIERGTGTTFTMTEPRALDPRHPLSAFVGTVEPMLTSADLAMLAESLPPSTCAAVFVIEQVWAKTLDDTLEAWDCPRTRPHRDRLRRTVSRHGSRGRDRGLAAGVRPRRVPHRHARHGARPQPHPPPPDPGRRRPRAGGRRHRSPSCALRPGTSSCRTRRRRASSMGSANRPTLLDPRRRPRHRADTSRTPRARTARDAPHVVGDR